MQQVLFTIPILKGVFPPEGIPIYGFGAMLFVTFILVTWWGTVRSKPIGMPATKFQDFTFIIFISGLIGARLLYMIQYTIKFPDHSLWGTIGSFFKIWEGGIIFYGAAFGGAIGYGIFYWFVLRRMNVSGWQLADAVAPLLAFGLALGRIGCYLNGCCGGQVACEPCATVPLGAAHFPLFTSTYYSPYNRDDPICFVTKQYLQTTTGFALLPSDRFRRYEDPRPEVSVVEPGSTADLAGIKPGDRIVKVDGNPAIQVEVVGPDDQVKAAVTAMKEKGGRTKPTANGKTRVEFDTLASYHSGKDEALKSAPEVQLEPGDTLEEAARTWPRGKTKLALSVERDGKVIDLPAFIPQTVGVYPTQLYETVSMLLLMCLLLAYYPFRRHDGQLMVVLMIGYAVHRFINESLRIEPVIGLGLTLSQWGSVVIFTGAVLMEAYLWRVMPSRWKGEPPPAPPQPQPAVV
jgi:phosphatidylglycerol:prolipoprotein diacylglycerol transferase